jgi:hypothetical protein
MTDRFAERLSEYLDGELDAAARAELERHLETCPSCQEDLAGLKQVVARLDAAPQAEPAQDLWPSLQGRIQADPRQETQTARWPERWLPAAAVLAATVFLWVWWMNAGPGRTPSTGTGTAPQMEIATAGRAALAPYRQAVEEWRRTVNLALLPEPLASSLQTDLDVYDQAVAQGLAILDENPDDVEWTGYMIHVLQAQARLLVRAQEATEMLS